MSALFSRTFVLGLLLVSTQGFSQDKSNGCGPGWFVTKRMSFSATTTRGTTNSYVTPFAMTSGTSGCAKHTIAANERRSLEFLATNYSHIASDVAKGDGEYLVALSSSLGCPISKLSSFRDTLRSNFREIFLPNDPELSFNAMRQIVVNHPDLSSCMIFGVTG
jgi:hypothetical protein